MIKLALPAGDLRVPTAELLAGVGLSFEGYAEGSRAYHLSGSEGVGATARVFRERDIPIQVALGNYDLGICNLAWVKELALRFPSQPIVPLVQLGIGNCSLLAGAADGFSMMSDLQTLPVVRIASEFPSIAEAFALSARIPRYRVQAVWGSAGHYPPEDADLVVVSVSEESELKLLGLTPLHHILTTGAGLIANENSLRSRPLGEVLSLLREAGQAPNADGLNLPSPLGVRPGMVPADRGRGALRLALPDGHQQRHVAEAVRAAGLRFEGYDETAYIHRPRSELPMLEVKVVRPHDMPQLVATGEMDLAITGRDCLMEHKYRFPSSPAVELVDLQRGQYNLCAVVSEDVGADTIESALAHWRTAGRPVVRIASEFPATADYYARSRHIGRYQVIPIAGASEGFVPEDAELLIEGTETGKTLKENRLKAIDLIYRSTTCVIGHESPDLDARRAELRSHLLEALSGPAGRV